MRIQRPVRLAMGISFLAASTFLLTIEGRAASETWSASSTDALWSNSGNWSPTTVPGVSDTAVFNNSGGGFTTVDLGSGVTTSGITFDTSSAASYTIGTGAVNANTLTLATGGTTQLTSTVTQNQTINASLVLGNTAGANVYNIQNNSPSARLTLAGDIGGSAATTTGTLAFSGPGNVVVSGAISNGAATSLGLSQVGTGTVTLSGSNTFTGQSTIGTLVSGAGGTVNITGSLQSSAAAGFNVYNALLSINSGGKVNLTSTSPSAGVYVGISSSLGSGRLTVDGAGSTLATPYIQLGVSAGATGTLMISNGGSVTDSTGYMAPGNGGIAVATVTGSNSKWVNNTLNIGGNSTSGTATLNLQVGGTVTSAFGGVNVGKFQNSKGTVNQSGGVMADAGALVIGTTNDSGAAYNLSGGALNVTGTTLIDSAATNVMAISGGTATFTGAMTNNSHFTVTGGTVNLNGGLKNSATGAVTFSAGTMILAGSSATTFTSSGLTVGNGGATAAILKVNGAGTNFGTGVTLASNATLSGFGSITTGAVTTSAQSTLAPGVQGGGNGILTLVSLNTTAGCKLTYDLGPSFGTERLAVTSFTGGGNMVFTFNDIGASVGSYLLATFTSQTGLNLSEFSIDPGSTIAGNFVLNSNSLIFDVTSVPEPSTTALLFGALLVPCVRFFRRKKLAA